MAADHDLAERIPPLHLLLANLSGVLLEQVVRLIQQQPDMLLVGEVQGQVEMLLGVGPDTDILILGALKTQPPPGICTHLLGEYPHLRILVLAANGQEATLYWLGLRQSRLPRVSDATLLRTIRTTMHT